MARVRERKDRHRTRGRIYRVSFATAGFGVVALGLVLVPLPGPGWLVVAVGLTMLALEFDRAERMLDRILGYLERVAEEAAEASPVVKVLGVIAMAAGTIAFVGVAFFWDLPLLPL